MRESKLCVIWILIMSQVSDFFFQFLCFAVSRFRWQTKCNLRHTIHSPTPTTFACMRWRNWNLQALFQTSNSQYFDSFAMAQYYRKFTVVINSRCKILAQSHERNRNANDLELSRYGWNGTFCGRREWEAEKEDGTTLNCADWRRFSVAKRCFYRIWFNAIRLALHNYIAECNINLIGCQQVSIRKFRNRTQQSQWSKDIFAIYSFLIGTNKTLET